MTRRTSTLLILGLAVGFTGCLANAQSPGTTPSNAASKERVVKTDAQWKELLSAQQYRVLREKGTERAFTGEYNEEKRKGTYVCAGCGLPLFHSDAKFDSGSGWPSFFAPLKDDAVDTESDRTFGMSRDEILCARCGGHLGHVFPDGPKPSGLRYCVNSASLALKADAPKEK